MVRRSRRRPPRRRDQADRLGALRRDVDLPVARRAARDQDRPGLQAGRGRPAAGDQGHAAHRAAAARPDGHLAHQPAAAPRHLLDRGPRAAHRGPARGQPGRPHRRQARVVDRDRHHRVGRREGRRRLHHGRRPLRRHGREPALLDQARRHAVGARPRRGPPGPAPQRPARPGRAADRRRPPDGAGRHRGGGSRGRGVRLRDRGAHRDRLRHGAPVPPRHLSDRHRDPARGPAREVRRHARRRRPLLHRDRGGRATRARRRSAGGRSPTSSATTRS